MVDSDGDYALCSIKGWIVLIITIASSVGLVFLIAWLKG